MIISRTPFRISFFGGGTDYPSWYSTHGGSVLNTSIDKYCYITCRTLPPFFEHSLRIVYSSTEECKSVDEIRHPAVRETLKFLNIHRSLDRGPRSAPSPPRQRQQQQAQRPHPRRRAPHLAIAAAIGRCHVVRAGRGAGAGAAFAARAALVRRGALVSDAAVALVGEGEPLVSSLPLVRRGALVHERPHLVFALVRCRRLVHAQVRSGQWRALSALAHALASVAGQAVILAHVGRALGLGPVAGGGQLTLVAGRLADDRRDLVGVLGAGGGHSIAGPQQQPVPAQGHRVADGLGTLGAIGRRGSGTGPRPRAGGTVHLGYPFVLRSKP